MFGFFLYGYFNIQLCLCAIYIEYTNINSNLILRQFSNTKLFSHHKTQIGHKSWCVFEVVNAVKILLIIVTIFKYAYVFSKDALIFLVRYADN